MKDWMLSFQGQREGKDAHLLHFYLTFSWKFYSETRQEKGIGSSRRKQDVCIHDDTILCTRILSNPSPPNLFELIQVQKVHRIQDQYIQNEAVFQLQMVSNMQIKPRM